MVTEALGCINQEGKLIPGSWKPSSPAPRWGLPTGRSQPPVPLPGLVTSFVSSCVCEGPSARPGPVFCLLRSTSSPPTALIYLGRMGENDSLINLLPSLIIVMAFNVGERGVPCA